MCGKNVASPQKQMSSLTVAFFERVPNASNRKRVGLPHHWFEQGRFEGQDRLAI